MRRPAVLTGIGLLCAVLTTSACGTRMDRADVALAERGGLQLTSQAAAAPGAANPGAVTSGTVAPGDSALPAAHAAAGAPVTGATGGGSTGATTPAGGVSANPGASSGATASGAPAAGSAAKATATTAPKAAAPGAPATPSQPAPAAPAGGKSPVAIGTVATLTGPVGAFVKDSVFAVSVWVKTINGKGGVNGHPVRHIVADDGGDPARYNANVRQLVEEQGVVAFIFNTIGFAGGDLSYVNQKRVPIIGHEAGTELGYASPMVFTPFPAGEEYAYTLIAGLSEVVVPAGKTKLATIACSDVKLCDLFDKAWNGPPAKERGFTNVYRSRASLTQPDFTAECISAQQAGAQTIIAALDNNSYMRLARSCARQNYKPVIGIADQLALPSLAADPVMEGDVIATKVAPWPGTEVPGVAELHQAFAAAAAGVEVNGAHAGAWVAAKVFELAARNLPDKPTAADVLNGLWSIANNNVGGLTFPLTFTRDQTSPRKSCWGVAVVQGGKFVAPKGGLLTCK